VVTTRRARPAPARNQWRANPERLAWSVILVSFGLFVSGLIGAVVGIRWWFLYATEDHKISNTPNGTVLATRPGRTAPEANLVELPVGTAVETQGTAQTSLVFITTRSQQAIASLQVFGNTRLSLEQADSPRFAWGVYAHRVRIKMFSGRIRTYVGVDVTREVELVVETPDGAQVRLAAPGSNASIEILNGTTMITVRDGMAQVTSRGAAIVLAKDQRAEVVTGAAPHGPLPAEQNLIKNGDFGEDLASAWAVEMAQPADRAEAPGLLEPVTVGGRRAVLLARQGNNWGQVGIRQDLNRDVQGLKSVRLHLDMRLDLQDLTNCGLQGTECPLMAKINYTDIFGAQAEWLQGFYYKADPSPNAGLTFCAPCSPTQFTHLRWPQSQWQTYDSDNLLETFAANGAPIATLKTITLYSSGHSFSSLITDVQLLASE
jgi:hypothetical protein